MKLNLTTHFILPHCRTLELGPEDTYILDYVFTFVNSGRMSSMLLFCPEQDKKVPYYWVNYQKLLDDFNGDSLHPFLSINNKVSLRNCFDRYIEKGILYKQVVSSCTTSKGKVLKGCFTYFAVNPHIYDFLTNADCKLETIQPVENPTVDETEITGGLKPPLHPPLKPSLQANINKLDNNKARASAESSPKPVQNFELSSVIMQKLKELFDSRSYSFPPDFTYGLMKSLRDNGLGEDSEDVCAYLDWIYKECLSYGPKELSSYFKAVCPREERIRQYIRIRSLSHTKEEMEKRPDSVSCPVCGTHHLITRSCPECGLTDRTNAEEIRIAKKIRSLTVAEQTRLRAELDALYAPESLDMGIILGIRKRKEEIYRKYGIEA